MPGIDESAKLFLLPWRRVVGNVALGLPAGGHSSAADVLAQVGLADRQTEWPARLSGGQRQRVSLADRVILIEDGRIALDERISLARPRQRSDPLFGVIEKRILDRVLQQPGEASPAGEPAWPVTPVHGLRWAV